jgi:hypothetical protein
MVLEAFFKKKWLFLGEMKLLSGGSSMYLWIIGSTSRAQIVGVSNLPSPNDNSSQNWQQLSYPSSYNSISTRTFLFPASDCIINPGTWLSIFWARSPKYTSSAALITIGSAAAKIKNNLQHLKIQAATARACRSRNVDLVNQQRLHHLWIIQSIH